MGLISNGTTIFDNDSMASGFGGSLNFISKATASASASIEFSLGSYKEYKFFFVNIHASVDDVNFSFQANAVGESGFNETITSTGFDTYHAENGSASALRYLTGGDQAQGTAYQSLCISETENDASLSGSLHIFNPSSTTFVKHFMSNIQDTHGGYTTNSYYAGYFNTTSALDEISFKFASGNIDDGKILMFGLN